MTDWRGLCEELLEALDGWHEAVFETGTGWVRPDETYLLDRARAALVQPEPEVVADGPAVLKSREPASVAGKPSDEELLRPGQSHYISYTLSDGTAISLYQEGTDIRPELLSFARAVLARWGRPAPAPAGEMVELVQELRRICYDVAPCDSDTITRAADLLEQRQAAPVPVAVSERLPEPSVKVLAHYLNDLGKGRTICAIWVPAKTRSDGYGDDDFTEYDEASDTFYWPEGWYEAIENWDDLGYVKVDEGEVIYWQSLPKWPAHALPLPSGEVEA